jgi:hypothetical protein
VRLSLEIGIRMMRILLMLIENLETIQSFKTKAMNAEIPVRKIALTVLDTPLQPNRKKF